jgi:ABC-2 type transport system ATP-binding protein
LSDWIIETKGLTKQYSNLRGCIDIDITVGKGEVFGFLGPNGAGKSTLIKTLVGLLFPSSGSAEILGLPLGSLEAKKKIGYLPELFKYQEWMTGKDLLKFHAALYRLEKGLTNARIEEVLEIVNMKGSENFKIGTYSKGMQQRIGMASALICDPKLIFLDEPTSALDPIGRKEVRDIILELKKRDKTVFLNSHLLSEVEQVCDSAAIISHGHIIRQGKMSDLLNGNQTLEIEADNIDHKILSKLESFDEYFTYDGKTVHMTLKNTEDTPAIATMIVEGGGRLYSMKPSSNRLEELFIQLVEKGEQ